MIKYKLFKHQEDTIKFAESRNFNAGLFLDMGLGKTLVSIECFKRAKEKDKDLKLIVLCPISIIDASWGESIEKFSDFEFWNMRKEEPNEWDVGVINYESITQSEKRKAMFLSIIKNNEIMIVIDESSKIKNGKAQIVKFLIKNSDYFKYKLLLSGTPAPNKETEYYSQIKFLDKTLFHPYFMVFQQQYFLFVRGNEEISNLTMAPHEYMRAGYKIKMNPEKKIEFYNKIGQLCIFKKKKDCLDLPDKIDIIRSITMSDKQHKIYKFMEKHMIAEINDEIIPAFQAVTKLMKLRQITSGFAINEQGEVFEINALSTKMKELKNVLDELGDEQVIIWGNFRHEIKKINEVLGDQSRTIFGETSEKERIQNISEFQEGVFRYLICHPQSAGHGLTFVNTNYQIFFSLNYSYEQYEQASDRIHRIGQTKDCVYIHLLCKGTIDEVMYQVLQRKGDAQDLIYNFLKR